MCGIAGIFHLETAKPVDPARIRLMTDAMLHRGPDGNGCWTAPGIGLGHLRLSIIDLAGSAQPMLSEDEADVLTFNGEIYNFQEVRAELSVLGHRFRTSGDTEVILAAWRQWGVGCLDRLNGMFAFAIHDQRTQRLFIARDRLGVKPLHYAPLPDGSVIFASELKGLLAHPALRRAPDAQAVDDYLAFGYVPDHRCFVAGVKKLPAGHYLMLERGKPLPAPVQYWDVDFSRRARGSVADLEAELMHHMREAVASRMVADVPLGAFLSGGVDSSTVVALMAERSTQAVKTCSIGFDVAALDESDYARRIAERFATEHRSRTVSPDDIGIIDQVAAQFDEPFADASMLPTFRVCQLARENVTVALSGDGADEAFAGYRRHVFHHGEERVRNLLPQSLRGPVFGALGALYPKADWAPRPLRAKATLLSLARTGAEGYTDAVGVTGYAQRHALYSDSQRKALGSYRGEDHMIALMEAAPARTGLDAAQYADMKLWLPGDILTKVDRTSMAVSLEAREPLLDYRLIEFAATLPDAMRVRGGQGKWLMKRAMRGTLPDDILYRPKMGFVSPIAQWFRGPLVEQARAIASGSALARSGWFNTARLSEVAEAHIAGRSDNARLLWQLWMLDKALDRVF
ncbi:XrtA/PEP-CTERM system amidotransferase [Blastomonas fulva]|uniref:XrtA/PEP-CTERM system amidotransferase n=1 Tax=Blastomonas fulva TaxID=1550728 RepID=UPI0025A403B1|nr:XrtA/PEP-CTERM system amidotransferase [Blastomonas fulva]MDM7927101.1 amidotransferase 1, exosortase A system-associated [Blastomonas fulva]MDM7966905.1 amidotransferase 1, exosortase A system-associated [Blastomonas fulva]